MIEDLSTKEIQKGHKSFHNIHTESTKRAKTLEANLLDEVRKNGASTYAINLAESIQNEWRHVAIAQDKMNEYTAVLKTRADIRGIVMFNMVPPGKYCIQTESHVFPIRDRVLEQLAESCMTKDMIFSIDGAEEVLSMTRVEK